MPQSVSGCAGLDDAIICCCYPFSFFLLGGKGKSVGRAVDFRFLVVLKGASRLSPLGGSLSQVQESNITDQSIQ